MKMNGYKIDFAANTIIINADFAKAMNNPYSEEYKTITKIRKDFPAMEIVNRTHKTPTKYHTKSGEIFYCNQFKNLTYDHMESFINSLPENEELIKAYLFLKYAGALPQTSRYATVRRWFVAQFPEFRKNPLFYLYNPVKIIDIKPFLQKEESAS